MSVYSSSFTIENLQVTLANGRHLALAFKDLSPSSMLATARRVRPGFLYDPRREIEVYRKILDPQRWGTPLCYGADLEEGSDRYWLFLERVNGPLLWQRGRMESWQQAARWLAQLHADTRGLARRAALCRSAHLLRYDRAFLNQWLTRAERFLSRSRAMVPRPLLRRFLRLSGRYDGLLQPILKLPITFIHADFYPSNVIIRQGRRMKRVCPVDWEGAALASGVFDLAALTSGQWGDDHRDCMLSAYHEALDGTAAGALSKPDLKEAVEHCQLHLCIRFLGWSSDWSPPKRHDQDWLAEACRLADKLGA
jgi:aminoglycoside/choline kinase family phosphotransferase